MKFKDALHYYELHGTDFQNDLADFVKLQKNFSAGLVDDDFTLNKEAFMDKLLVLWADCQGGIKNALETNLEPPTDKELLEIYCHVITPREEEETINKGITLDDDLLRKKTEPKKELKTLQLFTTLVTIEIDTRQFMDLELELVYQALEIIADNKKKEADKAKRRSRKV